MGHVLTSNGFLQDTDKIRAIREMSAPKDKDGVRRFFGLVQYLAKFLPNLSQEDAPIRILLKSDVEFKWQEEQKSIF